MRSRSDAEEIRRAKKFFRSLSPAERRDLSALTAGFIFDMLAQPEEYVFSKSGRRLVDQHAWIHVFLSIGVPVRYFSKP